MHRFAPAHADCRALHFADCYPADAADVYAAWVHPALVRRWLFANAGRPLAAARVDARLGGELVLRDRWLGRRIDYRGHFTRIHPTRALAFTLEGPDAPGTLTAVAATFIAVPAGCRLAVVHRDVPSQCAATLEARWLGALYGLGETLHALARARARGAAVGAG